MPIVHKFCKIYISDKWSPALQIRTVLLSIQALLSAPNPDDPLANDVAELWKVYKNNRKKSNYSHLLKLKLIFCIFIFKVNEVEAIRNAKEWTRLYAL